MRVPRDHLKLRDGKGGISPPWLAEPLYGCAQVVNAYGYVVDAKLDIEIAGSVVVHDAPGGFPTPFGAVVHLPAVLTPGQVVRARQKTGGQVSGWSGPLTVRDHTRDFPAGLPRPEINPAPVYQCGSRTGVANLLVGSRVWITADGTDVGHVDGAIAHQGVNVDPAYGLGPKVVAHAKLCNDESPPSQQFDAQPRPVPLPAPVVTAPSQESRQLVIDGLGNGAHVSLSRGGVDQGTFRAWGGRSIVDLGAPVGAGEPFSAVQWLCPGDPPSAAGTATGRPCSELDAPGVAPIQVGATSVAVTDFVPDARIRVYVNGTKVGDGSGPLVILNRAIQPGDTIDVLQSVGSCVSAWVQELHAQCVAAPVSADPVALDLFPVGHLEYDNGTTSILGKTMHIRGSVYYPAQSDGERAPFNKRLEKLGRAPVVVLVHGRHDPSVPNYRGYDYFQLQLARMGIVVVSVDENDTFPNDGLTNIQERARLANVSIAYFQSLDSGGDPVFGHRLDFNRVGLMGHSRGGEAVVLMPELPPPAGVTIKGVLALAPLNAGATSGEPHGYAFMTILPAADGDLTDNPGARFYDRAHLDPFRCQLYVDFANHNYFNRQWTNDDAGGLLSLMARLDHERILSAYGCALFRTVLLGHNLSAYLSGMALPPGVLTNNVHISFEPHAPTVVDGHRSHEWVPQNDLGHPTVQSGGFTGNEHPFSQSGSAFNGSFFGDSIGMVATSQKGGGVFRSDLGEPTDLNGKEVWVRGAEVYDGSSVPPGATGFKLGLETIRGAVIWIDSDAVGGVPRPFDRNAFPPTKTMPNTFRFPATCFSAGKKLPPIRAILLQLDRGDGRALAFQDLEIVKP